MNVFFQYLGLGAKAVCGFPGHLSSHPESLHRYTKALTLGRHACSEAVQKELPAELSPSLRLCHESLETAEKVAALLGLKSDCPVEAAAKAEPEENDQEGGAAPTAGAAPVVSPKESDDVARPPAEVAAGDGLEEDLGQMMDQMESLEGIDRIDYEAVRGKSGEEISDMINDLTDDFNLLQQEVDRARCHPWFGAYMEKMEAELGQDFHEWTFGSGNFDLDGSSEGVWSTGCRMFRLEANMGFALLHLIRSLFPTHVECRVQSAQAQSRVYILYS